MSHPCDARTYGVLNDRSNVRLGIHGTVDLTVPDRQQYVAMAGIQIGFPLTSAKSVQITQNVPVPDLKFTLDPMLVHFKTNSAAVMPRFKDALAEIADYLKNSSDQWRELDIAGHADQRGSFKHNVQLSMERSMAIKDELKDAGLSESRMTSGGYGYTQLLDSRNVAEAHALNRRVEISFFGVNRPAELKAQLEQIQAKWSDVPLDRE